MEDGALHIEGILENINQFIKKPDEFLEGDNSLSDKIKTGLKQSYDAAKFQEFKIINSDALPELIIDNFDLEQIWQQIELQNDPLLTSSITDVSKVITSKDHLLFCSLEKEILLSTADSVNENSINDVDLNNHNDDGSKSEDEENSNIKELNHELNDNDNSGAEDNINDSDLSDNYNEENSAQINNEKNFINKKSGVEDDFFKLNEMEDFLKAEERKEQTKSTGDNSEESGSEAEGNIDFFENSSDDSDDNMKTARFKDFFVAKDKKKQNNLKKIVEGSEDEEDYNTQQKKSALELRQERLQKRIEEIEKDNVSDKPWQLRGEISADNRPKNSLLEEVLEMDLTSRPAPVITEQTSLQLDDIVKQRIKDRAFDSVERKIKPIETPLEYKKKLVLDQEKSKQSLAQIYEKQFLEQQASLDPESQDKEEEEPEIHKEIKQLMSNLFNKLDALSNFHFTPKPAVPELRIINNLPAVSMEEVAPVAATDSILLAPEEIKNKTKGDIIGKSERTSTDKNRERRKKKLKQRVHLNEKRNFFRIIYILIQAKRTKGKLVLVN
ncbi:hypothetical protein NQ317_001558 [Molorchus minor]|uniref:U3 small nucleolar ribonucleoprotein protein MPP10 n=1 Tax=Molorchus minor TaxID=1323400 RepID=A0ABQ9J508_9CUCU|nr:hypothetical protein NQ317_001558 [Molorchus minor]